jgi:hypothetical protein
METRNDCQYFEESLGEVLSCLIFLFVKGITFYCIRIKLILRLFHFCTSPAAQYGDTPHNEYKYSNNGPNNYYNNGPYRPPPVNWQPHQSPAQGMSKNNATNTGLYFMLDESVVLLKKDRTLGKR